MFKYKSRRSENNSEKLCGKESVVFPSPFGIQNWKQIIHYIIGSVYVWSVNRVTRIDGIMQVVG